MIHCPDDLPRPLQILVGRSLRLCELILPHTKILYPFAAVYEAGRVGCLFSDESIQIESEKQLIEQLQWRIIDTTTHTDSYSVLVYAVTVQTQTNKRIDAIAINASPPDDEETMLLYPFFRIGHRIVLSPPIHG